MIVTPKLTAPSGPQVTPPGYSEPPAASSLPKLVVLDSTMYTMGITKDRDDVGYVLGADWLGQYVYDSAVSTAIFSPTRAGMYGAVAPQPFHVICPDWELENPNVTNGVPASVAQRILMYQWFAENYPSLPVSDYALPQPAPVPGQMPFTYLIDQAGIDAMEPLLPYISNVNVSLYEFHPHLEVLPPPSGAPYDFEARADNDITMAQQLGLPVYFEVWDRIHDGADAQFAFRLHTEADWEETLRWGFERGARCIWWNAMASYLQGGNTLAVVQAEAIAAGYGANYLDYVRDTMRARLDIAVSVASEYKFA